MICVLFSGIKPRIDNACALILSSSLLEVGAAEWTRISMYASDIFVHGEVHVKDGGNCSARMLVSYVA